MLAVVTFWPDWLNEAFQMLVIIWLPGKAQATFQLLRPEAPAVTVIWPWNPPDQLLTVVKLAVQAPPPPPPLVPMVQVNAADPDAPVPSRAVTDTLYVPAVVGVPEITPV